MRDSGQSPRANAPSEDARFRAVYSALYESVRDYCSRRVPQAQVADSVADVFVAVWRRIDDVPTDEDLRPWVFGVARNVVKNHARSQRRMARLRSRLADQRVAHVGDPAQLVVAASQTDEVLAELDGLRPTEQEIIRLRVWEGMSSAEIGHVLGISAEAVDMRLVRVRRKLGRRVSPDWVSRKGGDA